MLEAAARAWVRTVVQASSVEVYDPDARRPFRGASATAPRSPYGMAKLHLFSSAQLARVADEELHGPHAPPGTWTEPPWRLAEEAVDCSLARRVLGFVPEHDVRSALRERRAADASGGGCLPARDRAVTPAVS